MNGGTYVVSCCNEPCPSNGKSEQQHLDSYQPNMTMLRQSPPTEVFHGVDPFRNTDEIHKRGLSKH
ncbi:MAG: hypothetical protein ACP5VS_19660, partial [Desulfomonilaceae bacterium]